jgi:uncharacterized protein (TIGR02996 family)
MSRTITDAFLQAILQAPDDDTPRLVYADWLEEQGELIGVARAEFIRIQCVSAQRSSAVLAYREQELLDQYGDVWSRPLRGLVRECRFHRGFIDTVTMGLAIFLHRAEALFQRAPVQHLHLRFRARLPAEVRTALSKLSSCEYVQRVRTLDLRDNWLDSTALQTLSVSDQFDELSALNLAGNRIGDAGMRALLTAPFFPGLTSLDLSRNTITSGGVRRLIEVCEGLAASPSGLRLRQLVLRGNRHATAARRLVFTSPLLRNIVRW